MAKQQQNGTQKLWKALNDSGYYTKSYEDFSTQFSTPEQQSKLYDTLTKSGYYTKSKEDFNSQFFFSQNGTSGQDSGSGAQTSTEPLSDFPSFEESNAAYAQAADEAILTQQAEQNFPVNIGLQQQPQTGLGTSITGQGLTQQEILTGADADFVGAQSRRLSQLTNQWQQANPDSEVPLRTLEEVESSRGVIKEAVPESWGKRNKERAQFVYNNLLSGIGSIANEAIDLGLQFQAAIQPGASGVIADINLSNYRANIAPTIRNSLVDVIGADLSDQTVQRYQNEMVTAALGGLAASAPAMIGSRLRATRFFLQGADAALQSIEQADVNGELSNLEKTAYSSLVGAANAALEKVGFDKIFKGNVNQVAQYVANRTLKEATKGGKKVTGDALTRFLSQNLSEATNAFARGGIKALEGALVEGATGSSQEAVNIGSEYAVNALAGKHIFDTEEASWDGFINNLGRIGESGLMEAIGGGVLGGGLGMVSGSSRAAVYEKVKRISQIDSQLDNDQVSDESKAALLQIKVNLAKEIETDLNTDYETFSKLTESAKSEITSLNEQAINAQQVIDDPNVSDEAKETAEQQLKSIDTQIDEVVEATKEAADIDIDNLPDEARSQIDEKNIRIQDIDIEKARLRRVGETQSDRIGELNEEQRQLEIEINELARAKRTDENPTENIEETPAETVETTDTATEEVVGTPIQEAENNLVLFHGTPHEFGEFSTNNIGTGEGNQAFGRGLYFTNERGIAENYANVLSSKKKYWSYLQEGNDISLSREDFDFIKNELGDLGFDGNIAEESNVLEIDVNGVKEYSPATYEALSVLFGKNFKENLKGHDLSDAEISRMEDIKKKISNPQFYEVEISSKPSEFMEWRSELSEVNKNKIGNDYDTTGKNGQQVYREISESLGSDSICSGVIPSVRRV